MKKKSFRITINSRTTGNTIDKIESIISELSNLDGVEINKEKMEIIYYPEQEIKIKEIMQKLL